MKFKQFQRRDYAAAALVKGLVLSHEQGLGKSFAAFAIPYVWRARRVLLAAPGDLHDQLRETAAKHFGLALPTLKDMDDVRRHKIDQPAKPLRKGQMPKFYLVGYEALTRNGADEWPPEIDRLGKAAVRPRERARLIEAKALAREWALSRLLGGKPDFAQYFSGIGMKREGITCIWRPSLARELKQLEGKGAGFDCVVLDEATAIQGESMISKGVTLLDPEFRMLMTGTPVKNRLESIFKLAWWAAGGSDVPTARWPYAADGADSFAKQHLEVDRFLTREEDKAAKEGKRRSAVRITRTTARVCNVQRVWRLLAPVVLRCRKADCGEDIVSKTVRPIEVSMGAAQAAVYQEHLTNRPLAPAAGGAKCLSGFTAAGMQITNLRIAALCPDAPALADVVSNAHPSRKRSWTRWTPKLAAVLSLISELLDQGEQVMIGSPFTRFNQTLHELLLEAKVTSLLLDGEASPTERGRQARTFKTADAAVLVASYVAMGKGHSFANCAHLIAAGYPWAYDVLAQFVDRIWRLDSPRPVTVYPVITAGSIEERMRDYFYDKSDTAQLTLDGKLFPETVDEVDPERLLAEAFDTFKADGPLVDETLLEAAWPKLAKRLAWSQARYREWHPPVIAPVFTAGGLARASEGIAVDPLFDFAVAKERLKQQFLKRRNPNS
ncbi:MAG: DEAD/DEAH box helicase [Verrucomicrobiota bacterium]